MVESSAGFDYAKTYAIKNVGTGKYIRTFNDSFMGMGADGVQTYSKERIHGNIFKIVPN